MPGPISDSHKGTPDIAPYVPTWCYPNSSPKICPCGHHEGYHADNGECLHRGSCGCTGLPANCRTSNAAGELEPARCDPSRADPTLPPIHDTAFLQLLLDRCEPAEMPSAIASWLEGDWSILDELDQTEKEEAAT